MGKSKYIMLFIIALIMFSGCSKEPLKFRNLLEADQYIRNNIPYLEWDEFSQMLSKDHHVSKAEFSYLKKTLTEKYSSSHIVVDNKLYRFNEKQKLMYMTTWKEKDGVLLLDDITYIPETNKQ